MPRFSIGSLAEGVFDRLDAAALAVASREGHPLGTWVAAAVLGVVVSIVLLGYVTETQPHFYSLMVLSLVLYVVARGEELAGVVLQYVTSPLVAWRWAFVAWAMMSLLWTSRGGYSVDRAITLLEIQAVGLVLYDAARNLRQTRWILGSVLASAVAAALYALLSGDAAVNARLSGTYRNPNTLGIVAVVGMAICCTGLGYVKQKVAAAAAYLTMMVLALGVLASASLKGLAGTAFVMVAASLHGRARRRIGLLAVIGVAVVVTLTLTVEPVRSLWEHTLHRVYATMASLSSAADVGQSLAERSRFIAEGLGLIAEAPVAGRGLNAFEWLTGEGTYAHNNYVEVGVSLGVIGVMLYYAFHLSILAKAWRAENRVLPEGRFAVLAVLLLMLLDVASVSYATKLPTLLLITCAGWLDGRPAAGRRAVADARGGGDAHDGHGLGAVRQEAGSH